MKKEHGATAICLIMAITAIFLMYHNQNSNHCPAGFMEVYETDINPGRSGAINLKCVAGNTIPQQYNTFPTDTYSKYDRLTAPPDMYSEVH